MHSLKLIGSVITLWLMVDGLVVYLGFRATKFRDAKRLRQASDQVSNISLHAERTSSLQERNNG